MMSVDSASCIYNHLNNERPATVEELNEFKREC